MFEWLTLKDIIQDDAYVFQFDLIVDLTSS